MKSDPEKIALKEMELQQALDDCEKDSSKCTHFEIKSNLKK